MQTQTKNGDLPLIAEATGLSLIYVRQVSAGQRKSQVVSWAKHRLAELKEQFKAECQEKFSVKEAQAS